MIRKKFGNYSAELIFLINSPYANLFGKPVFLFGLRTEVRNPNKKRTKVRNPIFLRKVSYLICKADVLSIVKMRRELLTSKSAIKLINII